MTIDAVDLDGVTRLAIELAIAMAVLLEVAVDTVHPFFKMNVLQMHSLLELVGSVERDRFIAAVEQSAFAIVLEHCAENPSVTMEVGELRVLQLLVELCRACLFQKCRIRPQAPNGRTLRVPALNPVLVGGVRVSLLGRPHVFAIHFVVPPGVAKVSGNHIRSRMNVADNALARWNRTSELVANGMAVLLAWNRGIGSRSLTLVPVD